MKTITLVEVLDALRQARDERGKNFQYRDHYQTASCQYVEVTVDGAEPACIAGNALHKLGVPLDTLMSLDTAGYNNGSATVHDKGFSRTFREKGFELETDAQWALRSAQQAQDRGRNWGQAYDKAWETVA